MRTLADHVVNFLLDLSRVSEETGELPWYASLFHTAEASGCEEVRNTFGGGEPPFFLLEEFEGLGLIDFGLGAGA